MASPEFEQKPKSEKFWNYTAWGTVLLVAVVAAFDFLGPQIASLENSLKLPH